MVERIIKAMKDGKNFTLIKKELAVGTECPKEVKTKIEQAIADYNLQVTQPIGSHRFPEGIVLHLTSAERYNEFLDKMKDNRLVAAAKVEKSRA